jgi:hypothetical protein
MRQVMSKWDSYTRVGCQSGGCRRQPWLQSLDSVPGKLDNFDRLHGVASNFPGIGRQERLVVRAVISLPMERSAD